MVNFTNNLTPDIKKMGVTPKEGLHIILSIKQEDERAYLDLEHFEFDVYQKKMKGDFSPFLKKCTELTKLAWCVNTNKCFDLPLKGIHSCSPYCAAFKRETLDEGDKYVEQVRSKKAVIHDRFSSYFTNAYKLLENEDEQHRLALFANFLANKQSVQSLLTSLTLTNDKGIDYCPYDELKGGEYVIFYLDETIEKYQTTNDKYLKDNLFNTNKYNIAQGDSIFGTSDFLNGYNSKKPFLTHQTATFDITGRISDSDAKALYEFQDIISRGITPRPMPIFIEQKELTGEAIAIFNKSGEQRIGYQEIIKNLYEKHEKNLGNYYLLFYIAGEIKDFDFVSKFDYHLEDENEKPWKIQNLFKLKIDKENYVSYPTLETVFDLEYQVFAKLLSNKFKKYDIYFNEIEDKYYEKLPNTVQAVRKYRKAIYDFVYKSMRQGITAEGFREIMLSCIKDDYKYDRIFSLKEKMNIFFSLNHHFDEFNNNFNKCYMPDKLEQLLEKARTIANSKERVPISDEMEFAFVAGQMIDFLLSKSVSENASHAMLEPFLNKVNIKLLMEAVQLLFKKYWHSLDRLGRGRVERLMSELNGFVLELEDKKLNPNTKNLQSFLLAGYFSRSVITEKKEKAQEEVAEMLEN